MKSLLIFASFIIFNTTLIAQTVSISQAVNENALLKQVQLNQNTVKYDPSNVKGTPYTNKDFRLSLILPVNKKFAVRYNAVDDQMEVMQNGKIIVLSEEATEYIINLDNKNYRTFKTADGYNYFVVVSENSNLKLLKKESKRYFEAKKADNSYSQDKPAKIDKTVTNTFYINYNNAITEVSSKNKILNLFPNKKNKIKKYLKEKKINFKQEKDMGQLFTYINSLLSQD